MYLSLLEGAVEGKRGIALHFKCMVTHKPNHKAQKSSIKFSLLNLHQLLSQ